MVLCVKSYFSWSSQMNFTAHLKAKKLSSWSYSQISTGFNGLAALIPGEGGYKATQGLRPLLFSFSGYATKVPLPPYLK